MPMSKRQANGLYKSENADGTTADTKAHKMSNWDLLYSITERKLPEQMAAAVFMRPKMTMRYHLLPVLARELAHARPHPAVPEAPATNEQKLRRSLALLIELADKDWDELPMAWWTLGSALETMDMELARENLDSILESSHVNNPMGFLKKFAEPLNDNVSWQRFFWLSDQDIEDFRNERQETVRRIEADGGDEDSGMLS